MGCYALLYEKKLVFYYTINILQTVIKNYGTIHKMVLK